MNLRRWLAPLVLAAAAATSACSSPAPSPSAETESSAVTQYELDAEMRSFLGAMCTRLRTLPGVTCSVDGSLEKISLRLAVGDGAVGDVPIPSDIEIANTALIRATNLWHRLGYPVPIFRVPGPQYNPRDPSTEEVPPLGFAPNALRTMAAQPESKDETKKFLIELFKVLAKADLKGLASAGKLLESETIGIDSGSGTVDPATSNAALVDEYKANGSKLLDLELAKSLIGVTDAAVGLTLGLVVLSGGTSLLVGATVFCAYTFPKFLATESISNRATALGQRQVTLTREMQRRGVPVPGAPPAGGGSGGAPSGGGSVGPISGGGGTSNGGGDQGSTAAEEEGGDSKAQCSLATIEVWGVPKLYIQCIHP